MKYKHPYWSSYVLRNANPVAIKKIPESSLADLKLFQIAV